MKTKTTLKIFIVVMFISTAVVKTNAQIVYVDIDPDTTIYVPDVAWNIDSSQYYDFNIEVNTVIFPFRLRARNYYFYSMGPQWGISLNIYGNNSYGNYSSNAKVAGGCAIGGFSEDIIYLDNINNFLNWDVTKYLRFDVQNVDFTCNLPLGDAYFGLMLFENSDTLYGWVRCSATDSSITIKDYAYNTIPNMPILAGQTELGIGNFAPSSNINIFENSGYLYVNITQPAQAQGYIRIYSQQGALVKADSINGQQNTMPLAGLAQGIYIVQVSTQTETVNKQIFLQGN